MQDETTLVSKNNTAEAGTDSVEKTRTHGSGMAFNFRAYVGMVAVILVIGTGLLFLLEKEGRINTGLFSGVIGKMEAGQSAATVNGVKISKEEFDSSLKQLSEMSTAEGIDVTQPDVVAGLRSQAIETLINGELLRQTAIDQGVTVSPDEIEKRFTEIKDGIGGAETLAAKMAEFGVTEESLRRDIENEFLIQGLFDKAIDSDGIDVTEEEIGTLYAEAGGEGAGLPPLSEVREQIVAQIRFDKEQVLINSYIQGLRTASEVEIHI